MKTILQLYRFSRSSRIIELLVGKILVGIIITVCMLGLFLQLANSVIHNEVIFFDSSIIHYFYTLRTPLLTQVMMIITLLGNQWVLGSAIIISIILLAKKNKKEAFMFGYILFAGILLNFLLKNIFIRPRPYLDPLVFEPTFSFPSGHAMNSLLYFGSVVFFMYRHTKSTKIAIVIGTICCCIVGLIGISRIYLGAHFPSDVLAGYAVAISWLITSLLVEKSIEFSQLFKIFEKRQPGKR